MLPPDPEAEEGEDDPRADVVGKICDHGPGTAVQGVSEIDGARVGVPDLDVRQIPDGVFEHTYEAGVDLVDDHPRTGRCERSGECPRAASDLDDQGPGAGIGEADDPVDHVRIGQEVLSVRLVRTDAVFGEQPPDRVPSLGSGVNHGAIRRHGRRSPK